MRQRFDIYGAQVTEVRLSNGHVTSGLLQCYVTYVGVDTASGHLTRVVATSSVFVDCNILDTVRDGRSTSTEHRRENLSRTIEW